MLRLTLALERSSHGCELGRSEHDDGLQLSRQLVGREVALEDAVLRTVEQPPQLPRLSFPAGPPGLLEDDERAGDPQRLGDELRACSARVKVRVDVAGEREVDRAVPERQRRHVGADKLRSGQPSPTSPTTSALWSTPTTLLRRCRVRKPVPQPMSRVRLAGRLATNRSTVSRSASSNASHEVASYSAARRA
jgi:hypothetical protein